MAGKYALYLPYKVLDSLSSGNVTDSQFREFITGLAEYDRTGTFPSSPTAGFSMMYELVKSDLDFAKAKYEDIVEKRRQAGRLGGAPLGNQNALGNKGGGAPCGNQNALKGDKAQEPEPEKQTQAKQAKQAESVVSSQLTDISKQIIDIRCSSSNEVVSSSQIPPQTTTVDIFINACKNVGFSLDRKKAQEIMNTNIDISWFNEPFTYPEYIAEIIQESYADKPPEQKRRLFRAIINAEDRIGAFPEWRKSKETEAALQEEHRQREVAAQEKRQHIDQARSNKPKICDNCGCTITVDSEKGSCPSCGWYYFFDDEKGVWVFSAPFSLSAEYKKILQSKSGIEIKPSQELSEYFICIWKRNSDVFNFTAKIKNQHEWESFWKACTYSVSDIDNRMENYISGVRRGDIDRRYIPVSPDSFVLNGWLQKSEKPFNKQKHRIANDNMTDDDINKYFTEIGDEPSVTQDEDIDF